MNSIILKIKNTALTTVAIFICSSMLFADDELKSINLNLENLMDYIAQNNVQIANQRDNLRYTKHQIDETKSVSRPAVTLSSDYTRSKSGSESGNSGPFNYYDYKINLVQPLFTYGKISSAIKIAEYYYNRAEYDYKNTVKSVELAAAQMLYSIILFQHQKEILLSTENTYSEHLANVKIRYDAGDATKVDYLSAKVNYELMKPQIIAIENRIENMKNELKLLLNLDLTARLIINEEIATPESLKEPINKDALISVALKNNENISRLESTIKISELQKKIAANELRPSVNLIANYGGGAKTAEKIFDRKNENALIGVNINFPLFDGFKAKNQVAEFDIELSTEKRNLKLLKDTISKDIENKLNDLIQISKLIKSNEYVLEQANESFRITKENYNAGASINLDVIEAEKNRLAAKLSLIEAKYNYIIATLELKKMLGVKLTDKAIN